MRWKRIRSSGSALPARLAKLTYDQSDVVQRAYYGGMTLSEVAADLTIPIGTVKGRLSTALRALRASLIPENADAG